MGEYADYMLNGDDCQSCGEYLGNGDGFPRECAACASESKPGPDYDYKNDNKKPAGKTREQWAQSIMDKALSAIKMHGNSGWSKADHKRFADKLKAVIQDGLDFKPTN